MKQLHFLLFFLLSFSAKAQYQSLDTIKAPATYENVFIRQIASDSLSSSFVIFIKKEVKKHKHASHTENVYILEGEGEMLLDDKTFKVKKGDMIFIPMNTTHSVKVTSGLPLKILSVQSPNFDGKDRIFID